jgi:Cu2+-exporting ATPase
MDFCQTKKKCTLCESQIKESYLVDNENLFCCHGCHAVYHILAAKKELDNFQIHPIFNQAIKSGLISNPDVLAQIKLNELSRTRENSEKLHLEIGGMWCPSCAEVIYLILMREKGVLSCIVDYATDFAVIEFLPRFISKEQIFAFIQSLGYKPIKLEDAENKKFSSELYLRFIVAAFCSFNVMMFSYPLYASYFDYDPLEYGKLFAWLSFFMSLPVVTFSFWPIFQKFLNALKFGIYGMEALVVLGVSSAFVLSLYELMVGRTQVYFDSMTVIITFVLLGKMIETKAKFSAKDSLLRLNIAIPRRVRKRIVDGSLQFVPIKEIKKNDVFAVFQGEKIPLDGMVIEGEGFTDESLMTGESLPIFKPLNSKVLGGSILQNGRLWIKAEAEDQESALKRIIDMVEIGLKSKSCYRRAVDPIIEWFVPVVLTISFITFVVFLIIRNSEIAFINALSVLLISCPCAIGIAAPLAESYLMSGLSKIGAIVRNRRALPFLGVETVYVFDKTGTITEGKFTVIKGLETLTDEDLAVLKGVTGQSLHLISLAIFKSIEIKEAKVERVEEITGKGLIGYLGKDVYHIGSYEFLKLEDVVVQDDVLSGSFNLFSKVYVSKNFKLITILLLGDSIRDGAKELIASLKPAKTILLSGDSENAVSFVAENLAFDSYYFGCSPLKKKELIENLGKEGHIVCMIGDGINDAPAMTAADVGVSVVTATDVTIQVSDILFTRDCLLNFLKVRSIAIFGASILKQNLFWAFFYNILGLLLASCGLLSPIFATFAMMASSLFVLYNAKRLVYKINA